MSCGKYHNSCSVIVGIFWCYVIHLEEVDPSADGAEISGKKVAQFTIIYHLTEVALLLVVVYQCWFFFAVDTFFGKGYYCYD